LIWRAHINFQNITAIKYRDLLPAILAAGPCLGYGFNMFINTRIPKSKNKGCCFSSEALASIDKKEKQEFSLH